MIGLDKFLQDLR